jgi:hypothetical protein
MTNLAIAIEPTTPATAPSLRRAIGSSASRGAASRSSRGTKNDGATDHAIVFLNRTARRRVSSDFCDSRGKLDFRTRECDPRIGA